MVKNLLYLAVGSHGSTAMISELKTWLGREFKIVGVDVKKETHGRYICDRFYVVPRFDDPLFISEIELIVKYEKIDLCVFGPTAGLIRLQEHGVVPVLSSPTSVLKITQNKAKTYEMLPELAPDHVLLEKGDDIYKAAEKLGYPDRKICFKPAVSSGGRGFRVIVPNDNNKTHEVFYERESRGITLKELDSLDFPPLLLMEYLEGKNYHIDMVAKDGILEKAVVSYRLEELAGLGYHLETTTEKPEYLELAETVVSRLGLSYNCFFQMIDNKLLEVGGRAAGSAPIGQDFVRSAVLLYEGIDINKTVRQVKMLRQWVPLFVNKE
jgi:carbamoyl-phosphate synthase large subunit